ncbi:MAG: ATP-dependent DNA helicase [Ruminococcaceae bacterium]|nr:ATP-dependent DNA helicase [Oscillospiraceae bacterium]
MRYELDRAVVTLSVGELCAMADGPRDLDLRYGSGRPPLSRALLGAEVHRRLQAEAGGLYTAEVSLTHSVFFEGLTFEISGRADGIITGDRLTVDEIKTVKARAFRSPPAAAHTAQLACYAYFLCCQRGIDEIQTRLSYYCIDDENIRYITSLQKKETLEAQFFSLLRRAVWRAKILEEHERILRPSAADGRFPFSSVRDGQDVLIKECYRDIKAGKRLFAEAPTGIGKTVSTLYPAIRALGEGHADRIFYLTAKAAVRREAFSAASALFEAGAHLRTVVLSARDQLCVNEAARHDPAGISRHCNPSDCPRARDFYERCAAAICELFSGQYGYSRATVEAVANKYRICPYEFQLELSELCDVIICDYNYVFDPMVYLRRYFSDDALQGRSVLLVDEAHNLADRARAMYSARLDSTLSAEFYRHLSAEDALRDRIEKLNVAILGMRRLCRDSMEKDSEGVEHGYYVNHASPEQFLTVVHETCRALEAWLREHKGDVLEAEGHSLLVALKKLDVIGECFDRSFLTFLEVCGDGVSVQLLCLDPASVLSARASRAHAAVFFSATLTPIDYFADILGGGKGAVKLSLPSPFDSQNLYLCAMTGISTRYEDREKSYRKLVSAIAATVSGKKGNYIAYFPSYDYMDRVCAEFQRKYPDIPVIRQTRGMSGAEKESFLDAFADDQRLRIGFCVLGGSFSEGVDLPGGRLIGSIIVGTGLSALSNEGNILSEHYESTRERGFDYAYVYPGMNRVLQAAGRVIRREEDCGVVILIDDRYADARTQMLFPLHWSHIEYAGNARELAENVCAFWKKHEN